MRTLCEKCLFSDLSDSNEPCKMNIINEVKAYHETAVSDNGFYIIEDYVCRYGFDIGIYDKNKKDLGTISDLEQMIRDKNKIKYYMLIDIIDRNRIEHVCKKISTLPIKPGFVSFLLNKENRTEDIINTIKINLINEVPWKIHNFLEEKIELNEKLTIVTDTNAKKNDTVYFWVDQDTNADKWAKDIENINNIIYTSQPRCHAMFRSEQKDGLLLSFDSYKLMRSDLDSNIFKALENLENPQFIYYA